jgi:hypothetical protein
MRVPLAAAFVLLQIPSALRGQTAANYLDRYREVRSLKPVPGQIGHVSHLVLRRDAAELTLEQGTLYLLTPIDGRTVGAVFQGLGRFRFTPALPIEQGQLERFAGASTTDDAFTEAVLLFADSTFEQLRDVKFSTGHVPGDVEDRVRDVLEGFKGDNEGAFDGAIMGPLLNGEVSGFFLAHLQRTGGDPVLFRINPMLTESIELFRPVSKRRWGSNWAVVTRMPAQHAVAGEDRWQYRDRLAVPSYRVDVRLTPTGSADLDFMATATLTVVAVQPVGPWLRFGLHPKLLVDSSRWENGGVTAAFKAKDDDDFWVRAPQKLKPGDSLTLTVAYHGNLIDRYGDWFYIDPSADWYPENRQGDARAMFDLTYHSPNWYPIASIGERTDSSAEGRVMTTRWRTRLPTPFATFNLGLFETYHVQHEGAPPLDVLINEDAHRLLKNTFTTAGAYIPQQRNMRQNVAADVSNSLKWFTHLFGAPQYERFYVTEIPYFLGVSFPGVIHLSWTTFQNTSLDGFDEFFRAHEVAHQWWGNAVRPASYRDAWLSEGLASFSALWYLQTLRKRSKEYFQFFEEYRGDIKSQRTDAGPIWLGLRNASPDAPSAYQVMTYEKGAWVFHMLRTLMLDVGTRKEDRFAAMLRDYHETYRGGIASTDDFRRLVERHTGIPMEWFFDQWVKGTDIPTYRVAWTNEPAADGKHRIRLRIHQDDVPPDFQMFVLVSADLGQNRFANFRVRVRGDQTEYTSPLLPAPANTIVFNELHSVLADVKMERW